MRLFIYQVLTQTIILLGAVRKRLFGEWGTTSGIEHWEARKDRTFYASSFETWQCCDCGMIHQTRPLPGEQPRFPACRLIPVRPAGYAYRWRKAGAAASPFVDETIRAATHEEALRSIGREVEEA